MHGVVAKADGTTIEISLGEKPGEPVFCVTDLLPHLGRRQNERHLGEGIRGEELNILVASLPYQDDAVKEPVKLLALEVLHEKYGIDRKQISAGQRLRWFRHFKASDVGA